MANISIWEQFDPSLYIGHNFDTVHDEDKHIVKKLLTYFTSIKKIDSAIEIGTGPNLYPVLMLLPFSKEITCLEFSTPNIQYLNAQLTELSPNWYHFWKLFRKLDDRYDIDLTSSLLGKVKIKQGSIFNLEDGRYDLAFTNSCLESITNKAEEFKLACEKFAASVKHGGHLVAVFMENSTGWSVGGVNYPAIQVDHDKILNAFRPYTTNLSVYHVPISKKPLRVGYTGMVLLTANRL